MYTKTYHRHAAIKERSRQLSDKDNSQPQSLFNELTFFQAFNKDLASAKREVIIYSPYVSKYRAETVYGQIAKLTERNVDVFIFTRPAEEYESDSRIRCELSILT